MRLWGHKNTPTYQSTLETLYAWSECDRFVALSLASGLVRFSHLSEVCSEFDTDRTDGGALTEFCELLIEKHLMTRWQCDKLRAGKWKGFIMDDYRLLGPAGSHGVTSNQYLAEDVSTGKQVTLSVQYRKIAPYIEYSVVLE
jgi:eukaryotic-like serine/threonine-protein kinase